MTDDPRIRPVEILLVEDNPGDVRLTREALHDARIRNRIHVACDGVEAIRYLRQEGRYVQQPRPDLILLDLNLPKKDGHQVLAEIKAEPGLAQIPVVVLTSSTADADVEKTYQRHANCYVVKPVDLEQFLTAVRSIEDFWVQVVTLPRGTAGGPR
jgi:two-component system, chemotaxis family, response regulator Rcp1